MLHLEFAISPTQIRNISDLTRLEDRLGFEKGAVLSRFPKSWLRDVSHHFSTTLSGQQLARATEKLEKIKESRLVSFGRPYDGDTWSVAAETSHQASPFHRVIDGVRNERPNYVLGLDELEENDFHFNTQFERSALVLAEAAKALLLDAEKVTLYDNYLCPTKNGHRNTLLGMMQLCQKPVEFHVFSEADNKPTREDREQSLEQFRDILPENIMLFWYWVDDDGNGLLHQRGLFTGKGGLIYDRGFEEPRDLDQRRTPTTITPMPRGLLEDRSRLFNPAQLGTGLSLVGTVWQSHP